MAQRVVALLSGLAVWACAGASPDPTVRPVTAPLPVPTLLGQRVAVFPMTYVVAEEALGWQGAVGERDERLRRADALIEEFFGERVPDVSWVFPDALREAARRAPGMLQDPDRMGTAALQGAKVERIPSPLVSQLRNLTAVAGDRLVVVPAALVFSRPPDGSTGGMAHLTVVVADVRHGLVVWRGSAYGVAPDPWAALRIALDELLPIRK